MTENSSLDILKSAILLETRGKAFYRTAANQSTNRDVKEFFETMAAEEVQHVQILSEQFKAFKETGKFKAPDTSKTGTISHNVLTPEVKSRIAAADFEAAAISAAMLMEERAITLYASRGKEAQDPEEQKLYQWLADWEKEHLSVSCRHRCRVKGTDLERQRVLAFLDSGVSFPVGTFHSIPIH
jgi:rubrerythrin